MLDGSVRTRYFYCIDFGCRRLPVYVNDVTAINSAVGTFLLPATHIGGQLLSCYGTNKLSVLVILLKLK